MAGILDSPTLTPRPSRLESFGQCLIYSDCENMTSCKGIHPATQSIANPIVYEGERDGAIDLPINCSQP